MNFKNRTSGYTLLEVLTVVAIIGIFTGIAIPLYNKTLGWSQTKADILVLESLNNIITLYKETHPNHSVFLGKNDNNHHIDIISELERCGYLDPLSLDPNSLKSSGNGGDFHFHQYKEAVFDYRDTKNPISGSRNGEKRAWRYFDENKKQEKFKNESNKNVPLSPETTEEIADLIYRVP